MIEKLIQMQERGELKEFVKAGIISTKVPLHLEIYLEYDKRIRLGHKSADIIFDIHDMFKISQRTIYDVIKKYK